MESLPAELMLQIFDYVNDIPTLAALVHASPSFHKVYAANRAEIFTAVTLRSLEARNILFKEPTSFVDVCFKARNGSKLPLPEEAESLRTIFKKFNLQIESQSKGRMVFNIDECLLLGKIMHMTVYIVENKENASRLENISTSSPRYRFLVWPNIWKMRENGDRPGTNGCYRCGVLECCPIIVGDFTPEQRHEILRFVHVRQIW